jgi:serine/threonine-protein kinase RsbW
MTAHSVAVRKRLRSTPRAPSHARAAMEELEGRVRPEALGRILLVVSELVTNSVRHAGSPAEGEIELRVGVEHGVCHVEVEDSGAGFEPPPSSDPIREGRWGLYLVDGLSQDWGVRGGPPTRVWADLAV